MSKNDRVPALPSEERLAQVICDFLDRDSVEVNPPADPDYELARIIRNEFATAAYLAHVGEDIHGYNRLAWRILAGLIGAVALIILIAHPWSAS